MGFVAPYWLALLIPAGFLIWRFPHHRAVSNVLRSAAALCLALALAQPYWQTTAEGRDVMLLVDQSLSMPGDANARALETIRLLEAARETGDALGIIAFGSRPHLERAPSDVLRFGGFEGTLDGQASDLAGALALALDWIPPDREGSIIVLSDGLATGGDPRALAQRAAARGIRIDVLPALSEAATDSGVERFDLPAEVHAGEPFQFEAWVHGGRAETRHLRLERDGLVIAERDVELERGPNRFVFRDVIPRGGVATYRLDVEPRLGELPDARPQNDHGLGAVRVVAAPRVLLLNENGADDTLAAVLRAANIPVDVRAPEDADLTRVGLTAYRAVIVENVFAERVGYEGMHALADFVVERGGGLWMTGGRASFGIGGYHLSPLDPVLPVASDMRSETRKIGMALGLVLDRSGSMGVEVEPGTTKMDLANNGAIAALEMLGPIDDVTVFAVDTSAHEVVRLQSATNLAAFRGEVLGIQSQGGGIFTYNGLLAAGQALEDAAQVNRHIILFADAADAEQPEGVEGLIGDFQTQGITVSVIALGTEADPDAAFLRDVAAWGGGEIYFTTEARELPRLFAQDTMNKARASFITDPFPVRTLPGLYTMGEFGVAEDGGLVEFPSVAGYNQVHVRPETSLGALVVDENGTPLFATAQRGAGRTASFAGQIGGQYGGELLAWPAFGDFVTSVTRYLIGDAAPDAYFATSEVLGETGVVRLEVDPAQAPDTSKLDVHVTTADGRVLVLPMHSIDERHYEVRFDLERTGVALGTLHLSAGRSLDVPPLALPYSPEFRLREDPADGQRLLEDLGRASGGSVLASLATAFDGPREGRRWIVVRTELLIAALLLLLAEIAVRRLGLFVRGRRPEPALAPDAAPAPKVERRAAPVEAPSAAPKQRTDTQEGPPLSNQGVGSMEEALERARKRAGKRLGR